MIRKSAILTLFALPSLLAAGDFGPLLRAQDDTFPEEACAIHLIHAVGGDFVFFGRKVNGTLNSWTYNAFNGKFSEAIPIGQNVFCCGVSQLPDGRPIIVGGDMGEANGATETYIFDLANDEWDQVGNLSESRWYPTPALLSDGTLAAISGWGDPPPNVEWRDRIDIFNAANGTWADFMPTFHSSVGQEPIQPHFYPFMFPYYDSTAPTTRKLFFAGRSTVDMDGYLWTLASFSLSFASNGAAEWRALGGNSSQQGSGAVMMINGSIRLM